MRPLNLTAIAVAAVLATSIVHAQWQLPPGTSSSSDDSLQNASTQTTPVSSIVKAETRLAAQDWAGAIAILRPLVAKSPSDAHAQYDLGFALDAQGDSNAAAQAFEAAAKADPQLLSARVSLGLLLARQNDAANAGRWLREAVALPADPGTKDARAQAYRALARLDLTTSPDTAREDLLAAVRLSGERPEDLQLSGEIAESLHDDTAAETAFTRALAASPGDADAAAGLTRALLSQGKQSEAEAVLQKAVAQHPASTVLLSAQADLLLRERRFDEVLPLLERLHTAAPDNTQNTHLLARAYVATGRYADAEPLFAALTRREPQSGSLLADRADCLIREKKNAEAEDLLQRALTLQFPTPEAKANAAAKLAFAAAANHDPETVLRAVPLRNSILPPDAPTTFLLATAHDTLHHTSQAAVSYRQFLDLAQGAYPDEAWQAQQRLQVLRRAK